jgi:hypothetical protein
MPTNPAELKAQLLRLAEEATGKALDAPQGPKASGDWALTALRALEAAEKVESATSPAAIDKALENLNQELVDAGLMAEFLSAESAEAMLRSMLVGVRKLRGELTIAQTVESGYGRLRELLEGLLRDFSQAETETAARIAARIDAGLTDAEAAIERRAREVQGLASRPQT